MLDKNLNVINFDWPHLQGHVVLVKCARGKPLGELTIYYVWLQYHHLNVYKLDIYDTVSVSKLLILAIAEIFESPLNSISAMAKLF